MSAHRPLFIGAVVLAGCSSGDFQTAAAVDGNPDDTSLDDAGNADSTPADTVTEDTPSDDSATETDVDAGEPIDSSDPDSLPSGDSGQDAAADALDASDSIAPADTGVCNGQPDGTSCGSDAGVRFVCEKATCLASSCGDGFVDVGGGEECDNGPDNGPGTGCETNCKFSCHSTADCTSAHPCITGIACDGTHKCSGGTKAGDGTPCSLPGVTGTGSCSGGTCILKCTKDADCDDGNVCNGAETCTLSTHTCANGSPLVCPTTGCLDATCDPSKGCGTKPNDSKCADPYTCTANTCTATGACSTTLNNGVCPVPSLTCFDDTCVGSGGDPVSGCKVAANPAKCPKQPTCYDVSCVSSGGDAISGCLNTPNNARCNAKPACFDHQCGGAGADPSTGCSYTANVAHCTAVVPDCYDKGCVASGGDSSGCAYTPNASKCAKPYTCDVMACGGSGCTVASQNASACDDGKDCTIDTCTGNGSGLNCTASATPPTVACDATAGCKHATIDGDADGFSPKSGCGSKLDCDDTNSSVSPNQTGYFATPDASNTSSAGVWDYNCSGAIEFIYVLAQCNPSASGCKLSAPAGSMMQQPTVALCGTSVLMANGCDTSCKPVADLGITSTLQCQ